MNENFIIKSYKINDYLFNIKIMIDNIKINNKQINHIIIVDNLTLRKNLLNIISKYPKLLYNYYKRANIDNTSIIIIGSEFNLPNTKICFISFNYKDNNIDKIYENLLEKGIFLLIPNLSRKLKINLNETHLIKTHLINSRVNEFDLDI